MDANIFVFVETQGDGSLNERYRLKMTIIEADVFCANSVNYLMPTNNIYYFLGLGNSHLLNWFFKKLSTNSNVNGYEVDNLPIISPDNEQNDTICSIVKEMLVSINDNSRTSIKLEQQLNEIVFRLYGLTEQEIAEVEKAYQ